MPTTTRASARQYWVAIRAMVIATVVLGIVYPLAIWAVGLVVAPSNANGSTIAEHGTTIGSSLIGQSFTDRHGAPLTQWFQSRPSAAGTGYDANNSSGSNLGPNNPALVASIEQRKTVIERTYGVTASEIPADAVTASASGLDPDISPAYARLQISAVAHTRGISVAQVAALVQANTQGRILGFLGDPVVNVVTLNRALALADPTGNER